MSAYKTLSGNRPLIIAHRGASGHRPEHTLEGYRLAAEMGADYIEPDLVVSKDGHLIIRHDRYLSTSTDVADHPEFAGRQMVKEGREEADWFVEDFTLDEIQTLRARQPYPGRSTEYDGQFTVPTFDEVLALGRALSEEHGRTIGVYPEAKHPSFFKSVGLDHVPLLLSSLERFGHTAADAPIYIQSFEPAILRELRHRTAVKLIHLLPATKDEMPLEDLAEFADAIGPYKNLLVEGEAGEDSGLVGQAHALGLEVHPWTFRNDALPRAFATPEEEIGFFLDLGIDGIFSDFPDTVATVLNRA